MSVMEIILSIKWNKCLLFFRNIVVSLLFSTVLFSTANADEISEDMVRSLTRKAVELIREQGDDALATIGKTNGEYHQGALYVFVYDENVRMLAHPVKPTLVGKSFKGRPDIKGKPFRDEIVRKALSGGGWTEYVYQKPGERGLFLKKVYSQLAVHAGKKYIVACGKYIGKM